MFLFDLLNFSYVLLDVRQLAGEVAEPAGGWDDGEVFPVELLDLSFEFFVAREAEFFVAPNNRVKAQ